MKNFFFSIAISAMVASSFVFVACNRSTKEIQPSENAIKHNTRNNKNSNNNLFLDFQSVQNAYLGVIETKINSLRNDAIAHNLFHQQLHTYTLMSPQTLVANAVSLANTLGFTSPDEMIVLLKSMNDAAVNIKNAHSNLSSTELADFVALELNWYQDESRKNCQEIYDAAQSLNGANWRYNMFLCAVATSPCFVGGWAYLACFGACGILATDSYDAQTNVNIVAYNACIE